MKRAQSPLKIGIIGAGFSGTACAALFHRLSTHSLEIVLFEKTGQFGQGEAYSTPYAFHKLNVRARDMSVFEDQPLHYVEWLGRHKDAQKVLDKNVPIAEQFTPRFLYAAYLNHLLQTIQNDPSAKIKLRLEPTEVVDVIQHEEMSQVVLQDGRKIKLDKIILAFGNTPPANFPFPVQSTREILNPWDYDAVKAIKKNEPVLIVGTGLSMVDTVLTLQHRGHQAPIYAISRRGLLPLTHTHTSVPFLLMQEHLPHSLRVLTKQLRLKSKYHLDEGGDWRSVVNALRFHIPALWEKANIEEKRRFLRHVLPYWNIHRHRIHHQVAEIINHLIQEQKLKILAGRVLKIERKIAEIKLRQSHDLIQLNVNWVINCMGSALNMQEMQLPLLQSLIKRRIAHFDPLNIGFSLSAHGALKEAAGNPSPIFYAIGPLRKAHNWECSAVPEIRKHCFDLAKHILNME